MKNVLKYKGFTGSVHFSANDRAFFGKVEGVDDLITFEGSSVNELKEAFQYVVDEHIEHRYEHMLNDPHVIWFIVLP